ncbi:MAG: SH3 domain-containing protein [Bdellovibrionaceae bacterium]|nr:SH3 domain-containing protein [Pseudobdellovibrionaceae bacterium]
MKRLAAVLILAICVLPSFASALTGVVIAEEAQVYADADLDSEVIGVVPGGTKLTLSKGTRGEYAKFRKTRIKGKIGWISSLDVKTEDEIKKLKAKAKAKSKGKPRSSKGPFADEEKSPERDEAGGELFVFTRSVGLAVGMADYKESINGGDYSANLLTYGLKLTGTDVLLGGALMDVNILFHYGAPEYYDRLSVTKPTGFISWMDFNLLLPVMMREDSLIGIGLGPLLVLSNMSASDSNQTYSMWALNAGVTAEVTAGVRFGEVALRLDGKYWFERQTYRQLQIALQTVF